MVGDTCQGTCRNDTLKTNHLKKKKKLQTPKPEVASIMVDQGYKTTGKHDYFFNGK